MFTPGSTSNRPTSNSPNSFLAGRQRAVGNFNGTPVQNQTGTSSNISESVAKKKEEVELADERPSAETSEHQGVSWKGPEIDSADDLVTAEYAKDLCSKFLVDVSTMDDARSEIQAIVDNNMPDVELHGEVEQKGIKSDLSKKWSSFLNAADVASHSKTRDLFKDKKLVALLKQEVNKVEDHRLKDAVIDSSELLLPQQMFRLMDSSERLKSYAKNQAVGQGASGFTLPSDIEGLKNRAAEFIKLNSNVGHQFHEFSEACISDSVLKSRNDPNAMIELGEAFANASNTLNRNESPFHEVLTLAKLIVSSNDNAKMLMNTLKSSLLENPSTSMTS